MATIEPITGRYLHTTWQGREQRIYFEEAGQGIPLLCLHTAGSDGRQFRALLNNAEITRDYRVIAFDMPWHGKSSPPVGWQDEDYQLTTESYTDLIMTMVAALKLEQPVAMGCSIGGRIMLNLALTQAQAFRALIGFTIGGLCRALLRCWLAQSGGCTRRRSLWGISVWFDFAVKP